MAQREKPPLLLWSTGALLCAALLAYSQTRSFAWDEGFHLLAAQLIVAGKTPYIDFCFPQTPLNAYWNALWMALVGGSWRTAHAIAAIDATAGILLAADFLYRRFPVVEWRRAAALAGVLLIGLNPAVFEFSTLGQAYGLCLLLTVAAFRVAVRAIEETAWWWPALAGFLSCAAAASSLLTAPVAPVLLVWILLYAPSGRRLTHSAAFLAAGIVPFLPVAWLFVRDPRATIFNVLQYHLQYRQVEWPHAFQHDFDVVSSWINSPQALLLGLLALAGLYFVAARSQWDRPVRRQFYLCAWLAVTLAAHISNAHPSFQRYYLLIVPFLGIPAAAGLYWIGSALSVSARPAWAVAILALILCLGIGKWFERTGNDLTWPDLEEVARKVDAVTPAGAALLADEPIYVLTRRIPPSGMELEDSHKLRFDAATARAFHIVPRPELDAWIRSRRYDTISICDDEDRTRTLGLATMYRQKAEFSNCAVFWDKGGPVPYATGK